MMRIYHGTTNPNLYPQFGGGKSENDYGSGFYCTPDIERAKEWACKFNTPGYVYEYYLNTDNLNILDLSDGTHSILEWLSILISNRVPQTHTARRRNIQKQLLERFLPDTSPYDVIIGPRADDSYFMYARDFLTSEITITQLKKAMQLGNLGLQVALISRKSFDLLKHVKTRNIDEGDYYLAYKDNDERARRGYTEIIESAEYSESATINNIIEEGRCVAPGS